MKVEWEIAIRPGKLKTLKSSIRPKVEVEHPFRVIKRQFGFVKVWFKRLCKNDNQLAMMFTLVSLFREDPMIRAWESWPKIRDKGLKRLNDAIKSFIFQGMKPKF